jgi:hypothetical protein
MCAKLCQWHEGCERKAIRKERFCPKHRYAMLRLMKASGYLVPLPSDRRHIEAAAQPDDLPVGSRGLAAAGPWDGGSHP